jgi:hypothetical protein
VSNLVRNVLEEAFTAVEEVTDDVGGILEEVMDQAEVAAERFRRYQDRRRERARGRGEAPREAADRPGGTGPGEAAVRPGGGPGDAADPDTGAPQSLDLSEVVAWQPVVLNVEQRCVRTGRSLRPGEDAYLGLTPRGFSGHYLSREGLAALR